MMQVKEKQMRSNIALRFSVIDLLLSIIGLVAILEGGTRDVNKNGNLVEHHH